MTDKEILTKLGLNEHDATHLIQAVTSVNAHQAKVLPGITADATDAARALGGDCTAEDVERFLKTRKGHAATAQFYFSPVADSD